MIEQWSKQIKEEFLNILDVSVLASITQRLYGNSCLTNLEQAPITGRISPFLPFLTFSPSEQAVLVHKFLLELAKKARTPINLSTGPDEQLLGKGYLRIQNDASVCQAIADSKHYPELGARSMINGVRNVEDIMVETYLNIEETVIETDRQLEFLLYFDSENPSRSLRISVLGGDFLKALPPEGFPTEPASKRRPLQSLPARIVPLLHVSLSTVSNEIRVLDLSRDLAGHLCGNLGTISLTDPGSYVALSYR